MTFEQLSKQTGKAGSLLHRYSKRGMPTSTAAEALAWIASNVRQKVSAKPQQPSTGRKPTKSAKGKRAPRAKPLPANPYQDARTRQAIADAEDAELRVLERRQVLVHVDVHRTRVALHLGALKDAFLQMPARLAAVLAAEPDEAKCHNIVQDEIFSVLARLADIS